MAEYQRQFDKSRVKRWRRDSWGELRRLGLDTSKPECAAGLVMVGVYSFGTDLDVLNEVTGLPRGFVRDVLKRMRKERILVGQTMRVRWDKAGMEGAVALTCDALVISGLVNRPPDPKRSAAQRRVVRTPSATPRQRRVPPASGAVFTPRVANAHPWYKIADAAFEGPKPQ
jgi:hypothetical protein